MATKRSYKEFTLKTKYQALKKLEEVRTNKYVSSKFNVTTGTFQLLKRKQILEVFHTS